MTTTISCNINLQQGFDEPALAIFSAAGMLLVTEGTPPGAKLPDEFKVEIEGSEFAVKKDGEEHYIVKEDHDAFVAMVFG